MAIVVNGHEHARTAVGVGAFFPEAANFVVVINLVVLKYSKLDKLVLVSDLLGLGVVLLLALLTAATKTEH